MDEELHRYFWARVEKNAVSSCWVWVGSKQNSRSGWYGRFHWRKKHFYAHRIAYADAYGPPPPRMHLDHLCRNTLCVNPAHLELVTARENVLRGIGLPAQNARLKVARCGHPLTFYGPKKVRMCVPCWRDKYRAAYFAKTGRTPPAKRAAGTAKCGHLYDAYRTDGSRCCSRCIPSGNRVYSAEQWYARCKPKNPNCKNGILTPLPTPL